MKAKTTRTCMMFTVDELARMDHAVSRGYEFSRSALVRRAIREFLDRNLPAPIDYDQDGDTCLPREEVGCE